MSAARGWLEESDRIVEGGLWTGREWEPRNTRKGSSERQGAGWRRAIGLWGLLCGPGESGNHETHETHEKGVMSAARGWLEESDRIVEGGLWTGREWEPRNTRNTRKGSNECARGWLEESDRLVGAALWAGREWEPRNTRNGSNECGKGLAGGELSARGGCFVDRERVGTTKHTKHTKRE